MSRIRSKGNKTTEVRLRAYLIRFGVKGWKLHAKDLIGKPDFVFEQTRIAIFIDGAFWHGAPNFKRFPKSRLDYWKPKIERNQQRDRDVTNKLRNQGWAVLRFWDYELEKNPTLIIRLIKKKIHQRQGIQNNRKDLQGNNTQNDMTVTEL